MLYQLSYSRAVRDSSARWGRRTEQDRPGQEWLYVVRSVFQQVEKGVLGEGRDR